MNQKILVDFYHNVVTIVVGGKKMHRSPYKKKTNRIYKSKFYPLKKKYGYKLIGELICLSKNISGRCSVKSTNKYEYYGGRGIKNKLSLEDLIFLWKRDRGDLMENPSIDRLDTNSDYSIENCRFLEMDENRIRSFPKSTTRTICNYGNAKMMKCDCGYTWLPRVLEPKKCPRCLLWIKYADKSDKIQN